MLLLRVVVHKKPKMFYISLVVEPLEAGVYGLKMYPLVAILQLQKIRLYIENKLVLQGQLYSRK